MRYAKSDVNRNAIMSLRARVYRNGAGCQMGELFFSYRKEHLSWLFVIAGRAMPAGFFVLRA